MPFSEVPFRVGRAGTTLLEFAGWRPAEHPPSWTGTEDGPQWIRRSPTVDPVPYVAEAERILLGSVPAFDGGRLELGEPIRWNRDPRTGRTGPLRLGKAIDYRDVTRFGDPKYVWEPSRHQHLVTLAQAYGLTGEARYLAGIGRQLESWLEQCPFPMGPNWATALEAAIRLLNWAVVWQCVGGVESPLFDGDSGGVLRRAWGDSVYQHAHFVRHYLSRYSSANNHLLGELSGLYVAGVTWPYWADLAHWRTEARRLLVREAFRQIAPDGGSREQAIGYHLYAADYLLLAALAGDAAGEPFPAEYGSLLQRMADFLRAITDVGGHTPMFGDSDGGSALRLVPRPTPDPVRVQAALIDAVTGRTGSAPPEEAAWLVYHAPAGGPSAPERRAFPDTGYFVLGDGWGTPDEVRIVADAGPLGLAPLAAHGHSDALSFTLSIGGVEFLIDPGTYDYYTDPEWREYFRGTGAHNTARVDGRSQSEPGGPFMWTSLACVSVHHWRAGEDADELDAEHDGYQRLADPVRHRRLIRWEKGLRRVVVRDSFRSRGSHEVELRWHFAEGCEVRSLSGGVRVTHSGRVLDMTCDAAHAPTVHRGSEHPRVGWRAPRFGVCVPSPTVVWPLAVRGDTALETVLALGTPI
jgi:hypothetical protein